jgi:hypothetical protein
MSVEDMSVEDMSVEDMRLLVTSVFKLNLMTIENPIPAGPI